MADSNLSFVDSSFFSSSFGLFLRLFPPFFSRLIPDDRHFLRRLEKRDMVTEFKVGVSYGFCGKGGFSQRWRLVCVCYNFSLVQRYPGEPGRQKELSFLSPMRGFFFWLGVGHGQVDSCSSAFLHFLQITSPLCLDLGYRVVSLLTIRSGVFFLHFLCSLIQTQFRI